MKTEDQIKNHLQYLKMRYGFKNICEIKDKHLQGFVFALKWCLKDFD